MSFKTGDKVRLTTGTLFVAKGGEGTIVDPVKGQTPPQLFPWRVQFPIGQDTRTVWCGTDELELVVDDAGPKAYYPVADGSRDYCPKGGPKDGDPADTAPPDPDAPGGANWHPPLSETPPCPCLTHGACTVEGYRGDYEIDYANNPELDEDLAERYGDEQEPWADDWTYLDEGVSDFEMDLSRIFMDAEALLLQKHEDYGPKNISQSPGGALNGLRVRMHDKLARLNHLVDKGQEPQVLDESLKDTLTDLANYAVIGIMVLEGTWPNE